MAAVLATASLLPPPGLAAQALPVTAEPAALQANALTAARNCLAEGERIAQILSLTVYVNAAPDYTTHAKIGDVASEYLFEQLGDAGIGPRAAIGVATLPGGAPVEIQLVAAAQPL